MNDTLWPFLQTKTEDHLQSFFLKKKKKNPQITNNTRPYRTSIFNCDSKEGGF